MLAPNTLLQDRYRILYLIKPGNMGAVYLAEDTRLGNSVALKETFSASNDALLREQFHREARLLSRLHHASLPRVTDHFIEGSGQFLVMDFIVGKDLMELLEDSAGPFPVNTVLDWADQLLDVLTYLHAQDDPVVHRDIKPANIKLTPQGKVILLDFGLAKGATSSMLMSLPAATMAYAPIEQVLVQGTDPRSDLYSLGVTLYHLLTNTFPPLALKRQEALWKGLPDPLPSAGDVNALVPEAIARVLTEAMGLAADDRPQTATRMRELLRKATRPSVAAERDSPVVFKAQEVKRDSYETTLPFPADHRPTEGKPVADDIGDGGIRVSGVSIEMVRVPAGKFWMGSLDSGTGNDERPQHIVSVAAFHMARYEVTQAQWRAVATGLMQVKIDFRRDPSHFKGDNLPIEQVSWEEAIEFCDRLSRATGKTYRLPTEAEWEYACRATTMGAYAGDLDAMGWYTDNSASKTHPVGVKLSNGFGLYDMHGNVWEWCMDTWHENYNGAPTDGTAWTGGDVSRRVVRGGSWGNLALDCRSTFRNWFTPASRYTHLGFRVVAGARTP